MDTSYKADLYSADLLEYVEQQYDVPADRVTALATNRKLYSALESVSPGSDGVSCQQHCTARRHVSSAVLACAFQMMTA